MYMFIPGTSRCPLALTAFPSMKPLPYIDRVPKLTETQTIMSPAQEEKPRPRVL